ncbi:hypothetical protein CANCADRAFT_85596 [Tortispora caseinolytica NRRL Y-17796]|uniref:FAD synthase n=1 Tax=Tortispora caseinolytica NRRL Y-17796 TaxID=767744 RepID=A0A1E4TKS8_9ASCO|nr:hypothetical protein CANCADRAFT_85596 [Tortispora caseinolytica NRRL Y-17796]
MLSEPISKASPHFSPVSPVAFSKRAEKTSNPLADSAEAAYRAVSELLSSSVDASPARSRTKSCVQQSMHDLETAIDRYPPEQIAMSFNGGKDCQVMLILFLAVLHLHPDYLARIRKIPCVYVRSANPFPELEDFIKQCAVTYSLDIQWISLPLKQALQEYLKSIPSIKAMLIGTRRTDPHGEHLTTFSPTDGDFPQFMRICPILDWKLATIWDFLTGANIPYCSLYDKGYTSIGSTTDTKPNPALLAETENGSVSYLRGPELLDDSKERLGRD